MAGRVGFLLVAQALAAAFLAFAPAAWAATTSTVVDIHPSPGVTQRVLDVRPDAPIATIVALPGGNGTLGIRDNGNVTVACFPFYRARLKLADLGVATVLVDAASDGSVWRPENVGAVIDWAHGRPGGQVWLSGGSSSANPAATILTLLPEGAASGAVFFSPDPPGPSVSGVRQPSLVVINPRDALQAGSAFLAALTGASVRQLASLTGGNRDGCGYHLFQDLETEFAQAIATFLVANGATGGGGFDRNQAGLSGAWANPATDSQGFVLDVAPDLLGPGRPLLFGGWFTFDATAAGGVRWYTIQGALEPSGPATMAIYRTLGGSLDSAQATTTEPVGTVHVDFADCTHASLDYAFDGGPAGTIPLVRLLANATCSPGAAAADPGSAAWSGAWADPGNSGQGLVFDFDPVQNVMFAAWYAFGAGATPASGPGGQDWYTLQAAVPPGAQAVPGITIFQSSGGVFDQHASTTTEAVGEADLVLHGCTSATLTYAFTRGRNAGRSGVLDLARLTPAPAGCPP
jgi:hypothetical protein